MKKRKEKSFVITHVAYSKVMRNIRCAFCVFSFMAYLSSEPLSENTRVVWSPFQAALAADASAEVLNTAHTLSAHKGRNIFVRGREEKEEGVVVGVWL
jgi:hypothetical protein